MKKALTTTVFLLIASLILAQNHSKDEAAINAQVDAMIYSWNHHNYDDLKNYNFVRNVHAPFTHVVERAQRVTICTPGLS